ncbi:MAG: hypothetical protein AAF717_12545 [Bacteroidota bacterium]
MYGISTVMAFGSVYLLYIRSNHFEFRPSVFWGFFMKHKRVGGFLSALLFLISTILLSQELGTAVGIILGILQWTLFASVITLFMPFKKFKALYLILLCLVVSCVELLQ